MSLLLLLKGIAATPADLTGRPVVLEGFRKAVTEGHEKVVVEGYRKIVEEL